MTTRILVAAPITLLVLLAIFVQGWVLTCFAVAIALVGQFEVIRALDASEHTCIKSISSGFAIFLAVLFVADCMQPPDFSMRWLNATSVLYALVAAIMLVLVVAMLRGANAVERTETTVFTLVYPQLFFSYLYLEILYCRGLLDTRVSYISTVLVLLMLFAPPVLSDTVAYFWGRAFGRKKLCPTISPNKTVAGAVAGLIGGAVAGLMVWWIAQTMASPQNWGPSASPGAYIVMGLALAAASQFGDLVASCIKRYVGIKDFGSLLPGHGGVLDRIDSTMFVMPIVAMLVSCSWIGMEPLAR